MYLHMLKLISLSCLLLFSLIGYSLCQEFAIATVNPDFPKLGDSVRMECTLFREQLFSTDIVNYIVNFDFNQFSSVLNRDTGVVGGIDASRLQAATSSSDDRSTLSGAIIVSDLQKTDFVDGVLTLGCVGMFGSNAGENINVTASACLSSNSASTHYPTGVAVLYCLLLSFTTLFLI